MEKIILLSTHEKFSPKTLKILTGIAGIVFIAQGILHIISDKGFPIQQVIGGICILCGAGYLFYSATSFSKKSKYSSKVKVTDDFIEFKTGFFSDAIRYYWQNIKSIQFGSYRVIFQMEDKEQSIGYSSISSVSKEIKDTIREFASTKGVLVI